MKHVKKILFLAFLVTLFAIAMSVHSFASTALSYTGGDASEALESALAAAENGDVTLTLGADLVFSAQTDVGTPGSVPAGIVTIDGGGTHSIIFEGTDSAFAVNFYGNFVFRNVDLKNAFTTATSNAAGPWMVFPEGTTVFDTGVTGSGSDVQTSNRVSVAGTGLTFNSGSYKTVAGNVNLSGVNVTDVSVVFQGTSVTGQLVGGSYNGGASGGLVTGTVSLTLGGTATFTDRAAGGNWYSPASNGGGTFVCNTTSASTNGFIIAGCIGGLNAKPNGDYATYSLTVNSGKYNHYSGSRIHNGGATLNSNTEITVNGGSFSSACYGGVEPTDTAVNTHNGYCKTYINGGTFGALVGGGSWIRNNATVENSPTEVVVTSGVFNNRLFGGSFSGVTTGTGCGTQNGDSSLKITGGDFSGASASVAHIVGAAYQLQYFKGNSTLTIEGGTFSTSSDRYIVAGTYGPGFMNGDSTLTLGKNVSVPSNYYTIGGCFGTTDISGTAIGKIESGAHTHGFRQIGDVKVVISGNSTVGGKNCFGGCRSDLDGSVTLEISGSPTVSTAIYALTNSSDADKYCSNTGDVMIYISGGNINQAVNGGGYGSQGNLGVNTVGGNVYLEVSGGKFTHNIFGAGYAGAYGEVYIKFIGNSFNIGSAYYVYPTYRETIAYLPNATSMHTYLDLSQVTLDASTYASWFGKAYATNRYPVLGNSGGRLYDVVFPAISDATSVTLTSLPTKTTYASGDAIDLSGAAFSLDYGTTVNYNNTETSVSSLAFTFGEFTAFDSYASKEEYKNANAFTYKNSNGDVIDVIGVTTTGFKVCAGSGQSGLISVTNTSGSPVELVYHGFSIRLTPDKEGIRIKTSISKEQKNATKAYDGYEITELGCLVARTSNHPDEALTLELAGNKCVRGVNYSKANGIDVINAETEDRVYYTCVVMNIPELYYDSQLSFRPYIIYEDENGGSNTVYLDAGTYASPSGNLERSIRYVAVQLRSDVRTAGSYNKLSAAEKAYIDSVVGENDRKFADADEISYIDSLYSGRSYAIGDMHEHSNSGDEGRTSDGYGSLAEWKTYIDKYSLDFVAILDHRQVSHMFVPDWDETYFVGGTENGGTITEGLKSASNMMVHYNIIFPDAQSLIDCLMDIPEFVDNGYNGEWDGHWEGFRLTVERLRFMIEKVKEHGGMFVFPHPTDDTYGIVSDEPLDYFLADYTGFEVIYEASDAKGNVTSYNSEDTAKNYKAWTDLLALGKRVWACSSSDFHGPSYKLDGTFHEALPTDRGLTSIYSKSDKWKDHFEPYSKGDFAAGYCGVQMCIGETLMGSATEVKPGDRLIIRAGDIYNAHGGALVTEYRIDVIDKNGVVGSCYFDHDVPIYLSIPVEPDNYYRVEIFEVPTGDRIGIGNPIWTEPDVSREAAEYRIDSEKSMNVSNGKTVTSNFNSVSRIEMLTDGVTSAESLSTCVYTTRTLRSNDTAFRDRFGTGESYVTGAGKQVTGLPSDSYFEIDLGDVYTVDGYKIYNYRWGRAYCQLESWKVVVSVDGVNWTEVAYYTGNTFCGNVSYNSVIEEKFYPTSARYVRLCVMGIFTGGETSDVTDIRLSEFQVFGIEGSYGVKDSGTATLKDNGMQIKAYGISSSKLEKAFDGDVSTSTKLTFADNALETPFNVTSGNIAGTDGITSYVLVDLYAPTPVSGFDVTFAQGNTVNGYYVLYSADMTNWTAIRFDSLNTGEYDFASDQSVKAIAIAFADTTEATIAEIDVY